MFGLEFFSYIHSAADGDSLDEDLLGVIKTPEFSSNDSEMLNVSSDSSSSKTFLLVQQKQKNPVRAPILDLIQ